MEEGNCSKENIQISFFTKQKQYAVENTPYSVLQTINSIDLNTLVNALLKETSSSWDRDIEFDFVVYGELLRVPLNEHLLEKGVSSEKIVEIEYLESFPPPEPQDCLMHDDWVSAVEVSNNWILSGCYDNTIHLWTTRGKHLLTIPGHTAAVKGVAWISFDNHVGTFASASQDQTAMIWVWNSLSNSVECVNVCRGHERSLECISVSPSGKFMVTGGWDNYLKMWLTNTEDPDSDRYIDDNDQLSAKRMKTEKGKFHSRVPVMTLKGHSEAISGSVWISDDEVCTSSWDHTLRFWDAVIGGIKSTISGNKAFFDVSYSQLNGTLLTASADRHVRVYDPRSKEGSVIKITLTSHTQWVQSVRWSKTEEHLFISGAYDNQVKLWDVRSPKASLFELTGHEDKVFCCDWSRPDLIASGGADNTVRLFKTKKVPKIME